MTPITENASLTEKTNAYIGLLNIELDVDIDGVITHVNISNSRLKNMGRLLLGKTMDQALVAIPKLFLLCSQAQQTAAISAMSKVNQQPLSQQQKTNLANRCALEWLKEHSWQLWQMERELFGKTFAINESVALTRYLLQQIRLAQLDSKSNIESRSDIQASVGNLLHDLFGCHPSSFMQFSWIELIQWSKTTAPYAQLFRALQQDEIHALGSFKEWSLLSEEGSLSRQSKHPLVSNAISLWGANTASRTLARFIEMIAVNETPHISMSQNLGTALASRGTLNHEVSIDNNKTITRYVIDAPTDRYFSPNGLVEQSLLGQKVYPTKETESDWSSKWIRQLIWSIDPCVEFVVTINQPENQTKGTTKHA